MSAIRFLFRGRLREIRDADPTLTVLLWLRQQQRATGTKEGCAEGDCGACTVVVAEPDETAKDGLRYRAVNACIMFLPVLHGKQLLTVEDLAGPDGALHPAQRAMVEQHASQCGFCTPGFVMSLFAAERSNAATDAQSVNDMLAGNLCRCTGYGPIIRAAQTMRDYGEPGWSPGGDPAEVAQRLRALVSEETVALTQGEKRFYAPARLADAAALLAQHPQATLLAGGTDVGLWVTKQHRALPTIIYLGRIAELRRIETADGYLQISAGATYTDIRDILAAHWPDFGELVRRIGAMQVRNTGTIGGNIANGSPINDTPPALIALGARLMLLQGSRRREIPLQDYFLSYGKQDLQPGEMVEKVKVPLPAPGEIFRCYKICKRFDQDISALCGAFNLRLENGTVAALRICFGGMAATPKRALHTERALIGKPWTEQTLRAAMMMMEQDYAPISDMRASAEYRMQAAKNLLLKCWLESGGSAAPTRILSQKSVA